MANEYKVVNTISTSNSEVRLVIDGAARRLQVRDFQAVEDILKVQVASIGRAAVTDIEVGRHGVGTLTEVVLNGAIFAAINAGKAVAIEVENSADVGAYGAQIVRLDGVVFDRAVLGTANDRDEIMTQTLPFTFEAATVIQEFTEVS